MTWVFAGLVVLFLIFFFNDFLPMGAFVAFVLLPVLALMFVYMAVSTIREMKRLARMKAPLEVIQRLTDLGPLYQSRAEHYPPDEPKGNSGTLALTSDALVFLDWVTGEESTIALEDIREVKRVPRFPSGEKKLGATRIGSGKRVHTMEVHHEGGADGWWVANDAEWRGRLKDAT